MDKKITRLAVFDLDGTLLSTPLPTIKSKAIYKEKIGKEWPSKGWWSRPETLDLDIFHIPVIDSVIADYAQERQKSETLVIMLTGRIFKLAKNVEVVLASKNLTFDKYFYNIGGRTLEYKLNTLNSLLKTYPTIKEIHIFDDRDEHIPTFEDWGNKLVKSSTLTDFKITHVKK